MNTNQLIEQSLGIPLQKSPVYTAKYLLRDCYRGKEKVIRNTTFDLRDFPFADAGRDIAWRRDLEMSMIGKTVHHFDKNSQYLSACSSTDTGVGDPVHVTDGDDDTNIAPGQPGIYRVVGVSRGLSTFDGCLFPEIIEPGQEWITNDVLLLARKHAYTFQIAEAWIFPEYTRVLGSRDDKRNWAKRLWDARQALKPVDPDAARQVNEIAHKGLGSFATGREKYGGLDLIHPNWWGDVVGKARVNLLCNLLKYGAPVLVETDGLYYVTRDENWRTAVPGILERMGQLGGFKHEGSFTLTEEIYHQARDRKVGDLARLFKACGGER